MAKGWVVTWNCEGNLTKYSLHCAQGDISKFSFIHAGKNGVLAIKSQEQVNVKDRLYNLAADSTWGIFVSERPR